MSEQHKKLLSVENLRHAEYYEMQGVFDELYDRSKKGETFSSLMNLILSRENILLAYRNIKANGGSMTPGVDGQTIKDIGRLPPDEVVGKVRYIVAGSKMGYRPKPVKRKEIPKSNRKTRPLGIPCIWDRLIQQCIKQIMEPVCEARFSNCSYGFRPNCSVENAISNAYLMLNISHLYYGSNNTVTGEINDLGTFYTDENGQFTLTRLRDGWYKVEELTSVPGYQPPDGNAVQTLYIGGGSNVVMTFENVPLSAITVYKYDTVTGEAVRDAVFEIRYLTDTSGTGGTAIGRYKTGANGSFTVTGLIRGTYIVEELASDNGHVIDSAPQTAFLSGEDQDVVQLYFGNTPKGSVLIVKKDALTGKPLSDVEFTVTDSSGALLGNANGKFITDASGSVLIDGLNPGVTVVAKESRAISGYILDRTRPSEISCSCRKRISMFRLIITGGRDFDNYAMMRSALDKLLKNVTDDIQVICGMAKGADRLGEQYAKENGYKVRYFPADWDMDGRSAGFKRNVRMAENADALAAFWDGKSHGTQHMIKTAREKELSVRVIPYGNREKIRIYHGDLITDSKVDVICHQTNCQSVMGAGIAKQIHSTYPRVFEQYRLFCSAKRANGKSPLGSCQLVFTDETKTRIVANLFGQEYYGRGRRQTDYGALQNALRLLSNNRYLRERRLSLGFPYLIGCALGGGDWNIVYPMIEKELSSYPGDVQIWKL